jgi:DNA-directed RNA polymerase specialized sigma24 family protein
MIWCMTRSFVLTKTARVFAPGHNLRVWLMSILHKVFVDRTRARRAEAQRLARLGELVEQQLAPGQNQLCAFAKFGRLSSNFPTSSVRPSISSPSRV